MLCWDTMWKFQNITLTQILREINFEDSRSEKTAKLEVLFWANFSPLKMQKNLKFQIWSLKNVTMSIFGTSGFSKIDFT